MPQDNQDSSIFELEKIDLNIYRGISQDIGTGRIYGGQVLGQGIAAAMATVSDERNIHSAHAYFLRTGDHNEPVVYMIDNSRDGRSYSSRTITAIQKGRPICTIMCSFQCEEDSELDYAAPIKEPVASNAQLIELDLSDHAAESSQNRSARSKILSNLPFRLRYLKNDEEQQNSLENYWLTTNKPIDDNDTDLHRSMLAYCSDFRLLTSTLRAIGYRYRVQETMLATICHAIWFHRDFRIDDWLFTQCEPLSLSNGRGLAKGSIYNSEGVLVASTMQEGVVRKLQPKT